MEGITDKEADIIITRLIDWLGYDGIAFFTMCIDEYGAIEKAVWNIDISTDKSRFARRDYIPHAVHFNEGMQVRNFLRRHIETKHWDAHDFDNRYIPLLNEAIRRCNQKEVTNEQSKSNKHWRWAKRSKK
ncbi:MAG: hypothetical protein DRJ03_01005 [Chloroflexi bacterium]|nr:MAG: hypothetical protein DRJ03_01005 [Chloroflexota bacterium]